MYTTEFLRVILLILQLSVGEGGVTRKKVVPVL
jgi:hypothetical protein